MSAANMAHPDKTATTADGKSPHGLSFHTQPDILNLKSAYRLKQFSADPLPTTPDG
jgi:hypothetical protein